MIVANDNEAACPYEVREGHVDGVRCWYVARRGTPKSRAHPRISMFFGTRDQAYRCMAVLIADDRRRA